MELDSLSQSSKRFLIPMLCLWLYRARLTSPARERLSLVILVEEAHHVLYRQEQRAKETVMEMLLRQCREIGIGMIVVDQHCHLLSSAALGNAYTSICLNQKDPADISKAAALSGMDEEERRWLGRLPVGQGIVKLQDRWTEPFLIQVPHVPVAKGSVTDGMVASHSANARAGSLGISSQHGLEGQVRQIQSVDSSLNENGLAFLHDVLSHQDDGVRVRYARLGIGTGTGHRVKQSLLRYGWLAATTVRTGNSRKQLLALTTHAEEVLGLDAGTPSRSSLSHEYWRRFYATHAAKNGYAVTWKQHGSAVRWMCSQ
ncbi:MAG: hypothetical protein L0177_18375 [Chloroflexi bacterium]|nr:hypothetical protein [Chloroflexota bacterium]